MSVGNSTVGPAVTDVFKAAHVVLFTTVVKTRNIPQTVVFNWFKWMVYGLNAYVSPDVKLVSTRIEKPFRNLGATVLCEGINGIQDAFNIKRSVIRFTPILCSLQHHK